MISRLVALFLLVGLNGLCAQETPQTADEWMEDGIEAFFDARIDEATRSFDKVVELAPKAKPLLWQRGLALYYSERYQDGREQFETHQTANSNDVENAAWHFLCVARLNGIESARKSLISIKGDARIPMRQIHDLFAGSGSMDAVLAAANQAENSALLRNQLCFAHLYLGLYFEALGDREKAKEHILKAAIDYRMDHYMGKTAITHARFRGWISDSDVENTPADKN
jgi:lipoprotein NlpI